MIIRSYLIVIYEANYRLQLIIGEPCRQRITFIIINTMRFRSDVPFMELKDVPDLLRENTVGIRAGH
jgi:hypothetical protein